MATENPDSAGALPYNGALVRDSDPDRFMASLFVPADRRADLWALFAFNQEVAKTREVVSDTTLGLIRLQWWHDALAAIYDRNDVLEHEVVRGLAAAIRRHDLPRDAFEQLLYAREFDLETVPPANMDGLENYVEFTNGSLMRLAARIAGEDVTSEADRLALAKAYGLVGLIRAIPYHARQDRLYMPGDLVGNQSVEAMRAAARAVGDRAAALLKGQRPKTPLLRTTARQARLWLCHLKRIDFDIADSRFQAQPAFYALRLALRLG